ncbi:hypothetical protein [Solimicrobium silvestre]|uniref:Uncharacterized protein n=1 Tax=Solimicrobium silvestre TaxID=2099400 RepID=A0A2S9GUX5_9BURK|nr:hypothetical protein [Solimicrobium silvestre]PRC91511.1 hypothetical protein S2091_3789 [Solimicrobium silvestre]
MSYTFRALSILAASLVASLLMNVARAEQLGEHPVLPTECQIALRIVTSPEYLQKNHSKIPELKNLDEAGMVTAMTNSLMESIKNAPDQEQFCATKIRQNLAYSSAYHFPKQCVDFLPLLKKSFEDRVAFKTDRSDSAQQKMNNAIVEMLVLDETDPAKLVQRCDVGIQVMQVNLNDKHLREKYPLPAACEVFFADMEKAMILPSQFETIQRQRVIFSIENKDTPERLDEICDEISK